MVDHIDEGSMRNDYRELASDSKRTAEAMAHTYKDHPAGAHFAKAARHYDRALQAVDHGDDDEIVKHHDRGYNTFAKAEKMIKEDDDDNLELDEVSKATLDRYRQKAKQRFRAKGGINAALDKQDKKSQSSPRKRANEDIEPLDELSPKTLGSYVKKATRQNIATAFIQGNNRGDLDGTWARKNKLKRREHGIGKAVDKITKEDIEPLDKLRKESIVDLVMVDEEQPDASAYIEGIELRCNSIVDEIKENIRKTLFDFGGIDEARKPKPGSPGGSWVEPAVADRFKKLAKEKKQFASAKREIDKLKKKGK